MRSEPDLVHGAWTRRSVSIDGGPHFETQHVVWVQAGTCYADVRVPIHPAGDERCFAGRSGWDVDGYRWTHRLDLAPTAAGADDIGELSWEGDALIERGSWPTANGPVAYEEVWIRLPGDEGPWVALEAEGACLVRAGDHAITVADRRRSGGSFGAVYRRRTGSRWDNIIVIGAGRTLPNPDDPLGWSVVHRGIRTEVTA